jgi:hypoxanthine phosphoribosyltransferase
MQMTGLRVLFTKKQIQRRVAKLAAEIVRDFSGQQVILVGVLKGAAIFLSDLARQITLDATFDFIGVSSYGDQQKSIGEVHLTKDVDRLLSGANVILVEDIVDTGVTLAYLSRILMAHQPRCLRIAALLDKPSRRVIPIEADYLGFTIADQFVVGYGMDFAERYRNLQDICVLATEDESATVYG